MLDKTAFYINGSWVAPASQERAEVINPADETACATIALANESDVDQAVASAKAAFPAYAARAMEMGAPISMLIAVAMSSARAW